MAPTHFSNATFQEMWNGPQGEGQIHLFGTYFLLHMPKMTQESLSMIPLHVVNNYKLGTSPISGAVDTGEWGKVLAPGSSHPNVRTETKGIHVLQKEPEMCLYFWLSSMPESMLWTEGWCYLQIHMLKPQYSVWWYLEVKSLRGD